MVTPSARARQAGVEKGSGRLDSGSVAQWGPTQGEKGESGETRQSHCVQRGEPVLSSASSSLCGIGARAEIQAGLGICIIAATISWSPA